MEKVRAKRICIIGAGVSGLPCIKQCLEEGLEPVCYERTAHIGGLWNYRTDLGENAATVMKSTVVNTSKEMMAYSDFPPPADWPNFMHNTYVNQYLHLYANHFKLVHHIHFNTAVESVERAANGKWWVALSTGQQELFDGVMLCTGHHATPFVPNFKGLEEFEGRVLHSQRYRDYKGFEDKKVLIIGIGNSALDCAVELSRVTQKLYVSTRKGSWIWNRVAQGGMPYDIIFLSRIYHFLQNGPFVPWSLTNDYLEHKLQQRIDHDTYGLRPNHRFLEGHPAVNDALPNLICSGLVNIKGDVERFERNGVRFEDGTFAEVDTVILATGYTFNFPYLKPQELLPVKNNQISLYKYVFPPDLDNLAVIGLIQPIGSIAPMAELQARWATRVFAGKTDLPSRDVMVKDIEDMRMAMERRYTASQRHTLQVDFVAYMDQLAHQIGVRPPLKRYFLTDFRFWFRLFVGGNFPYVYRLVGPGAWPGAREAIETAGKRIKGAVKQRECRMRRYKRRGTLDEYLPYASMKWWASWLVVILLTGLWVFCSGPASIPVWHYFGHVLLFFFVIFMFLMYFNLVYDMSTMC